MISLSESATSDDRSLPLSSSNLKDVARLEYESIDPCEGSVQVESDSKGKGVHVALEAEILALREQLQSCVDHAGQLEAKQREELANVTRERDETLEERIRQERGQLAKTLNEFDRERNRYFAEIEGEVVKLALAIAARILYREVMLDPLLLKGVVRVALDQVAERSTAHLRVSATDLESWREVSASEKGVFPDVIVDEHLAAGECVIETTAGKVELGVAAQLQEIERSFFDLVHKRPR